MSNWCLNVLISGNMSWKFLTVSRITNKTGPGYHKSPCFTPLSSEGLYSPLNSTWCYTSITWNIQTVPAGHWTLSCCFPLRAQDGAVTFCANIQQVSWSSWSQKISNSRGMYSETLHRKKALNLVCKCFIFQDPTRVKVQTLALFCNWAWLLSRSSLVPNKKPRKKPA